MAIPTARNVLAGIDGKLDPSMLDPMGYAASLQAMVQPPLTLCLSLEFMARVNGLEPIAPCPCDSCGGAAA
jgi:hypothetical protein